MSEDQQNESKNEERRPEIVAFGVVLRRYRKQQGMTQEQVSWNSGVDRKFISRMEGGGQEPALGTIVRLTTAMGVDLGEFMSAVGSEIKKIQTTSRLKTRKTTSQ